MGKVLFNSIDILEFWTLLSFYAEYIQAAGCYFPWRNPQNEDLCKLVNLFSVPMKLLMSAKYTPFKREVTCCGIFLYWKKLFAIWVGAEPVLTWFPSSLVLWNVTAGMYRTHIINTMVCSDLYFNCENTYYPCAPDIAISEFTMKHRK